MSDLTLNPVDTLALSDSSDSVTLSDERAFTVGVGLADSVTLSDEESSGLVLSDVVVLLDDIDFVAAVEGLLADVAALSDAPAFAVGRSPADSVILADSAGRTVGKYLSDALVVSDEEAPEGGGAVELLDLLELWRGGFGDA